MTKYFVVVLFLLCACNFGRVEGQVSNDVFSTGVNTPVCVPVTLNDQAGVTLQTVINGSNGFAFKNYPPFYIGNVHSTISYLILHKNTASLYYGMVLPSLGYNDLDYGSTSISSSFVETGDKWQSTSYGGVTGMRVLPDDGSSAGNFNWGKALGWNVVFYQPGTYYVWVRGSSLGSTGADTCHVLYRRPSSSSLNFLTYNAPISGFTSPFNWYSASTTITVTAAETAIWPPPVWNFYVAMREDGFMIDQLVLIQYSGAVSNPYGYISPSLSCASDEVVYFPAKNFVGNDTFSYTASNGTSTSTANVTMYIGTPIPSPSPTPSVSPTPSISRTPSPSITPTTTPTPSVTPTPSTTPSPSVTPSVSATPSRTPSVTPSISVSPSALASASITPSTTPSPSNTPSPSPSVSISPSATPSPSVTPSSSPSATPSVTPSNTPTASVTPSMSPSPSQSRTPDPTPSTTPTPSLTPSPFPATCFNYSPDPSGTYLLKNDTSSNFGQTFRMLASGKLLNFTLQRDSTDSGVVNGTAYLFLGIATEPETGISIRAFPFSMNGPGLQVFTFDPPISVIENRYTFLVEDVSVSSANFVLAEANLPGQFTIQDEQLVSQTAVFGFCMLPDYTPSAFPTPSATPSEITTASPSPQTPTPLAAEQKGGNALMFNPIILGTVGGVLLMSCGIMAFFLIHRRRHRREPTTLPIEMSAHPLTELDETKANYQPIAFHPNARRDSSATSFDFRVSTKNSWNVSFSDIKLESEIGRGAFGIVYKAKWLGIEVAVKQLVLGNEDMNTQIQDFLGEAEVMTTLKGHPNITQLLGVCFEPLSLITEYVDNGSLRSWLLSDKPMDNTQKLHIAKGIAAGMLYLHGEGVIHRDLAARNILVDAKMSPKVSDFGLSRVVVDSSGNKTESAVGPIRWMAPEAMRYRIYNNKTDVWSYGVVLYEILTRRVPYEGRDPVNIATAVSLGELSLLPEIARTAPTQNYPPILVKIIQQCLQFNADARPLFEDIIKMFDEESSHKEQV